MFRIAAAIAAAAVFSAIAVAQQAAPALLLQAVTATQAAKIDYAFDFELDTREQNWRARFDPAASPQLRLVAPSRDQLDGGERRAFDRMAEDFEGVSWCASEQMRRASALRLMRDDGVSALYAFQPTRESIRSEQARPFADRLRGEVTLLKSEQDISRIRIFTLEAFSPYPLVRVDALNIVITCQQAPNGRRYAAETVTNVRGSALGQAFDERTVQRARNLSPP